MSEKTETAWVYCDWLRWEAQADGEFREAGVARRQLGPRPDVEILEGAWWPPAALLYRRHTVAAIGAWREDLPIIQDARFLLDAALSGARFVHAAHTGVRYRSYPGSLSKRSPATFLEDCYRNACDLERRWESAGTLDPERRRALASVYGFVARAVFPHNRERFREVANHLEQLEPGYVPRKGSRAMRTISRLGGFPAAVRVATWYEQLKTLG